MEDQTSWKGHTFTLLVFTGIVVLCSIFFILGMLVGRAQGQKFVANAPVASLAKNEAKSAPKDEKPDLSFYDSVRKQESAALQPAPLKPDLIPDADAAEFPKEKKAGAVKSAPETHTPEPAPSNPSPSKVINYQIGALRKAADAQKLLAEVKKKGFKAFILAPPEDDRNPYFRVQVGPFSDVIEAQEAKKKLEDAKYQPILKK
jgi:cell division septation protein DedD